MVICGICKSHLGKRNVHDIEEFLKSAHTSQFEYINSLPKQRTFLSTEEENNDQNTSVASLLSQWNLYEELFDYLNCKYTFLFL